MARFFEVSASEVLAGIPFAMRLATPCPIDVARLVAREDGIRYDPKAQVNVYDRPVALDAGRSTCSRRHSTGLVFADSDRQSDD